MNDISKPSMSARPKSQVLKFVRAISYLFQGRERWLFAGAVVASLFAAVFEIVGIASIFPFMSVILDSTIIDRFPSVHQVTSALGAHSRSEELAVLASGLALLFVVGNAAGAFNLFVQERFASRSSARLAGELFAGYMKQSLGFHTQRDSASLLKVVIDDVDNVRRNILVPLLSGFERIFLIIMIVGILLVRDPFAAITSALLLGGAYWAVFREIRSSLHRKGERFHKSNGIRLRIAQESLGGIRELKALCREQLSIEDFAKLSYQAGLDQAAAGVIGSLPRYVFETVAFVGVLIGVLWLVGQSHDPVWFVPTLTLYVFAGYKLLPALQQIFRTAVQIRFCLHAFDSVYADLKQVQSVPDRLEVVPAGTGNTNKLFQFTREVRFDDVSFWHDGKEAPSLSHLNLRLKPRESVGLVGRTGAGKSTLSDLILGFYEPTYGSIYIDDIKLSAANVCSWRRKLGYVPQQIFLANASIIENIGFGLARPSIDIDAVHRAAALAQAEEFILDLPEKYEAIVGERGVKLSGGQRQRIGIARALYNEPELVLMDEATSALDGLTEEAVMEAISALTTKLTVILIAHRLRTVQACKRIILLDKGSVVADGSYDQLMQTSVAFQRLASAGLHEKITDSEAR